MHSSGAVTSPWEASRRSAAVQPAPYVAPDASLMDTEAEEDEETGTLSDTDTDVDSDLDPVGEGDCESDRELDQSMSPASKEMQLKTGAWESTAGVDLLAPVPSKACSPAARAVEAGEASPTSAVSSSSGSTAGKDRGSLGGAAGVRVRVRVRACLRLHTCVHERVRVYTHGFPRRYGPARFRFGIWTGPF